VYEVYLEDIIRETPRELRGLCGFFDLEASGEYIKACSKIILEEPHETRDKIDWEKDTYVALLKAVDDNEVLRPYYKQIIQWGKRKGW
jgi:hypothetical protein